MDWEPREDSGYISPAGSQPEAERLAGEEQPAAGAEAEEPEERGADAEGGEAQVHAEVAEQEEEEGRAASEDSGWGDPMDVDYEEGIPGSTPRRTPSPDLNEEREEWLSQLSLQNQAQEEDGWFPAPFVQDLNDVDFSGDEREKEGAGGVEEGGDQELGEEAGEGEGDDERPGEQDQRAPGARAAAGRPRRKRSVPQVEVLGVPNQPRARRRRAPPAPEPEADLLPQPRRSARLAEAGAAAHAAALNLD